MRPSRQDILVNNAGGARAFLAGSWTNSRTLAVRWGDRGWRWAWRSASIHIAETKPASRARLESSEHSL